MTMVGHTISASAGGRQVAKVTDSQFRQGMAGLGVLASSLVSKLGGGIDF